MHASAPLFVDAFFGFDELTLPVGSMTNSTISLPCAEPPFFLRHDEISLMWLSTTPLTSATVTGRGVEPGAAAGGAANAADEQARIATVSRCLYMARLIDKGSVDGNVDFGNGDDAIA